MWRHIVREQRGLRGGARPVQELEATAIMLHDGGMPGLHPIARIGVDHILDRFEGRDMRMTTYEAIAVMLLHGAFNEGFEIIEECQGFLSWFFQELRHGKALFHAVDRDVWFLMMARFLRDPIIGNVAPTRESPTQDFMIELIPVQHKELFVIGRGVNHAIGQFKVFEIMEFEIEKREERADILIVIAWDINYLGACIMLT